MCNLYRMEKAPDAIAGLARRMGVTVRFPEGVPNAEPRDLRITDKAPILRLNAAMGEVELVERRWSWPAPTGKPVFNFRGENRRFAAGERCVALADGFYEFTAPEDAKKRTKDRWLFTWPGHEWFGIAALVRVDAKVGEAFTLLTCPPGPDVAPFHDRQVVLLSPNDCLNWLDPTHDAGSLVRTLPAGSLAVERA
jgi:putative SOS response-associated peptidase YedK